MDSQIIELLGRNRLTNELLRAGLEVAVPLRDRGIDLIAYADLETEVESFVGRPIQMKAASRRTFSLNRKYKKFPDLLVAYVWNLSAEDQVETLALTYGEALVVADEMGWTATQSWQRGSYTTTRPSRKLLALLEPYRMTPQRWWKRVVDGL